MSALSEALKDLKTRGESIDNKPETGSNENRTTKGRGDGYREAVSRIEAAIEKDAKSAPEVPTTRRYRLDRHHSGTLTIRLSDFDGGEMHDIACLTLDPAEVLKFLADYTREASYTVLDAAQNVYRGDCSTCKNVRLIDEATHGGRTHRVHCPDCAPAEQRSFPPVPQVGGGVK